MRFSGSTPAILYLMKLEKRKGVSVKQLPYKCKSCRGFHNSHLISRKLLQNLIDKYNSLSQKEESIALKSTKALKSVPVEKKINVATPSWKSFDLVKLLGDMQKIVHFSIEKTSGLTKQRIQEFESLSNNGAIEDFLSSEKDTLVENKILWTLFYCLKYKEFLNVKIDPEELILTSSFIFSQERPRDFENKVIIKYFSDHSLIEGLRHISEKCAGLRGIHWKKINEKADFLSRQSTTRENVPLEIVSFQVTEFITEASISFQLIGRIDKALLELDHGGEILVTPLINYGLEFESSEHGPKLHSFKIANLQPITNYSIKIIFSDVFGATLEEARHFKTGRMPDEVPKRSSLQSRDSWANEALPPGGGGERRFGYLKP